MFLSIHKNVLLFSTIYRIISCIIGQSVQSHLLLAGYTERENVIRLLSARTAIRWEREVYEEG